jgi:phosphoglycolate phosphatase-like HAD superfamily hydrolase
MSLRLVVDLDNTVVDYNDALARYVQATQARQVPGRVPSYSYARSGWFDSDEQFAATHRAAVLAGMFATQEPYPDAVAVIDRLCAAGAHVTIATYRGCSGEADVDAAARASTLQGLARIGLRYDDLVFARSKWLVPGDLYVDDAPYVLDELDRRGLDRLAFDHEYNRVCGGTRFTDWAQVPALVEARTSCPV